jgi:NADH-quinone oxidoreductase subunit E
MFKFSDDGIKFIQSELTRYETRKSAIIRCLYRAQDENGGWLSDEVVSELAKTMEMPVAEIEEVATFYTMFNRIPVGKYHIQVCCTLSCAMAGGRELTETFVRECGVSHLGETSKDGLFTISKVECLGSCDTAPMIQVNRDPYLENLSEESARKLVADLKRQGMQ